MRERLLTIRQESEREGDFATSDNTLFVIDGEPMTGISKADIHFRPNEMVVARLHMWGQFDDMKNIVPKFFMTHPVTGKTKALAHIRFADGEEYDF